MGERARRRRLAEVGIDRSAGSTATELKRKNVAAVKATIFGVLKQRDGRVVKRGEPAPTGGGTSSGQSKQVEPDPFSRLARRGRIVEPPFDPLLLSVIPENSTEVGPTIEAMTVNCEAFGWRLDPRIPVNERTEIEILRTLAEEQVRAENFFAGCTDEGGGFDEIRERMRRDFEATGMLYVEFLEAPGSGELDGINHLPSWTMRLGRRDRDPTEYLAPRVSKSVRFREVADPEPFEEGESVAERIEKRLEQDVSFEIVEDRRFKRFRRYVQVNEGKTTWFKELGDPRIVDCRDGEVVGREALSRDAGVDAEAVPRFVVNSVGEISIATGTVGFPVALAANPVMHLDLYSTRSSYGLPRYVGHLFSIFGSRAADEINYVTFKNQNVPNLVVTVANGQLTDDSADRIDEFLESIQSDDNYSKILVLEGEPVMEGMRDPGTVKIELKPLTKEQHTDALFVNYQEKNDERVRRAWRMPPVLIGKSDDFTSKTIDASKRLADEQVFGPERARFDRWWTKHVLLRLGIVWSTFRANSPNVAENADLVKLLAQGEKTGGLTPRISRRLISRVVNEDLGDVDESMNPDLPFSFTLAQIMKSDSATEAVGGGEPTSQGRSGLQVGTSERDRDAEAGVFDDDAVERLHRLLSGEVAARFGGFVPPALDPAESDDE